MRFFLRTLAITICAAMSFANAQAQVITADRAQEIANSFFSSGMKKSPAARSTAVSLNKSADSHILTNTGSNEAPTFHILTPASGEGFVIVSGEEIENPIIGYSFEGTIDTNNLPVGFVDYIADIDAQVKALRKYNAENPQKAAAARSAMQKTNYNATTMGNKVYLETASWGQDYPFNTQCFTSYNGSTNALTGCVPTAYAIIMRYHEWPLIGTGTLYNCQAPTYVEITDRTYDYSKMPLVYDGNWSTEQINEVAKLMSHLGHSFMVSYGSSQTSVSDPNNTDKPNKYFNYNLVSASYQANFTMDSWEEKIKESIDNGCPIPYASDNAGTGDTRHMFVLDGYTQNDYFHFNFGWNGNGNGWFKLDAITPLQGDNYSWQDGADHYAIFNFTPNKTKYAVNASVSPANTGTVSINGGATATTATGEYLEGATVTLAATANTGYTFSNWTKGGDVISTSKSCQVKVASSDNEYVANFLTVGNTTVNVSVTYNSSYGTVTGTSGTVANGTTLTPRLNEEVTLTATPADGYIFTGWTVTKGTEDDTCNTNTLTFVATGEMSVTANFTLAIVDYNMIIDNVSPSGSSTGSRNSTWTYNIDNNHPAALKLQSSNGSKEVYGLSNTSNRLYAYVYDANDTGYSNATYTLSVPDGYIITSYNLTYWVSSTYKGQVTVSNGTTTETPNDTNNHSLTATPNAQTAQFTISTSQSGQQYITIESFIVTVMKDGAGSGSTPTPTQYTITATANPGTAGSVTGGGTYNEGATVTLTATPNSGYEFVNWTSGTTTVCTNATYSFTANASASYVANFQAAAPTTFAVTTAANPATGGTATFAVGTGQATTSATVASGTGVTLYAVANDGYRFVNWTKGGMEVSTNATHNVTITEASDFVANFELEGTATEYPTPTGNTHTDNYLTSITTTGGDTNIGYSANAHPGQSLVVVPGKVQLAKGESFTMNLVAYSLGAGSSSVTREDMRYCHASLFTDFDQDFTFEASPVQTWGNKPPTNNVYGNYDYVMNITHTITVPDDAPIGESRIRMIYTNAWKDWPANGTTNLDKGIVYDIVVEVVEKVDITANAGEGGSVTINGEATGTKRVIKGSSVTLNATPASGYSFLNWSNAEGIVSETAEYTFTANSATTLTANFERTTYTISVTASPATAGTVTGGGTYNEGETVTLTATPNSGYEFVNWTSGTTTVSTDATYSFTANASAEYIANFRTAAPTTFAVTTTANPAEGGTATFAVGTNPATTSATVASGTEVTLYAVANDGYRFVNWTKGGMEVSTNATHNVTITEASDLVANFEKISTGGGGTDTVHNIVTNGTTGEASEESDSYYKVWTSSNSPKIILTSPDYTIYKNDYELRLRAATYTLSLDNSVDEDLKIVSYTINYEKNAKSSSITLSAEGEEDQTPGETIDLQQFVVDSFDPTRSTSFTVATGQVNQTIWVKSIDITLRGSAQATGDYCISVIANAGGRATVAAAGGAGSSEVYIDEGTEVTLTATPESGYRFLNWSNAEGFVSNEAEYKFTPTESGEYFANFMRTYTIHIGTNNAEAGIATVNGSTSSVTIDDGASITLVATPNDGYEFMGWEKDGVHIAGVDITEPYTIYNITYDATFTAIFSRITEHTQLEDGVAYKIRGRMEDGSYGYVYCDGTNLKYSMDEGSSDSYIFVVQKADDKKVNLISALGYYGWNQHGTLSNEYAKIEIANGIGMEGRTLYSETGTNCYTFSTDGNGNIKAIDDSAINKSVDGYVTSDFDFVEAIGYKFNVSVADGSNAKLGTINLPFATKLPDGITAYKAEVVDDDLVMTPLELFDNILPANTPVLIEGTSSGKFGFAPAPASNEIYITGFSGTLDAKDIDSNVKAYILSYDGAGTEIKFYKLSSTSRKINANKAYFEDSTGSPATAFRIRFAGVTGIDGIEEENDMHESVYDLQGRKLEKVTSPGIYIVDGKKKYIK